MDIDHINRDRLDNRIENLRVVTRAENLKNCKPKVNGLTGRELEVEELFKQGLTCTQIQEKLGIDRHLSARHLKSLGWKMKRGFAATKKRKGESQ
jgi:FixJ family two-component response regulator